MNELTTTMDQLAKLAQALETAPANEGPGAAAGLVYAMTQDALGSDDPTAALDRLVRVTAPISELMEAVSEVGKRPGAEPREREIARDAEQVLRLLELAASIAQSALAQATQAVA